MKIDELIERVSKLWNGSIHIEMMTEDDFSFFVVRNGKVVEQENPNAYNFAKKYDWKIYSSQLAINPILNNNILFILLRSLTKRERDLGDRGW
jgi:hypothetical protein